MRKSGRKSFVFFFIKRNILNIKMSFCNQKHKNKVVYISQIYTIQYAHLYNKHYTCFKYYIGFVTNILYKDCNN